MIKLIYKYMNYDGILFEDAAQWQIPAFLISKNLVYTLIKSIYLFFKSLISHIILLPSIRRRHQFFCHWELQISFELAREEMGGDGSGRRWRDKLTSMFELAFTHSGRESTPGNSETFVDKLQHFSLVSGDF